MTFGVVQVLDENKGEKFRKSITYFLFVLLEALRRCFKKFGIFFPSGVLIG